MAVVHIVGSGGSVAVERTPFLGYRVSDDIRKALKLISSGVDKPTFRNLLTATVTLLEGKQLDEKKLASLSTPAVSHDSVLVIISGLHKLLQRAIRLSATTLKAEVLTEDLTELKMPKEYVADIISAVYGHKGVSLQHEAAVSGPRLPKVVSVKWRIDVAISTSVLNRVLQPCVMMEMTLDSGKVVDFEIPMSKFHELRYNTACVLKEMEDLKKRRTAE